MDDQAATIANQRKSNDRQKAELERKKRNLWKVYNPTEQPFQVVLNATVSPEVWTVEAKSELIVPAYVAEKYFEEMTQRIITVKSDQMIIEENEKREAKGLGKLDLHTEQFRMESRNLKNLTSKRDKIKAILDRGLYEEYGIGETKQDKLLDRDTKEKLNVDSVLDQVDGKEPEKEEVEPVEEEADTASESPVEQKVEEKTTKRSPEELKALKIENLKKAREAKAAKNV